MPLPSTSTSSFTRPLTHRRAMPSRPARRPHEFALAPADAPSRLLAVLPTEPSAELRAELSARGIPVLTYPHDVTAEGPRPVVGHLVLLPADSSAPVADPPAPPAAVPGGRGLYIDAEARTVHLDGRPLTLTFLEFELLAHLAAHPNRVHTRAGLSASVWGHEYMGGTGRTVDVHVARLRRKLGPDHRDSIVTIRSVGYKYVPASADGVRAQAVRPRAGGQRG